MPLEGPAEGRMSSHKYHGVGEAVNAEPSEPTCSAMTVSKMVWTAQTLRGRIIARIAG